MSRTNLLRELLSLGRPTSEVARDLADVPWDSDQELGSLENSHLIFVLSKYLSAELSAGQVEEWANALECRDDIGYVPASPAGEVLHELANPLLEQSISEARARELLEKLSASAT